MRRSGCRATDRRLTWQDILLIDVREPDEVALGSIPSAVSLPLSELRGALDKNYSPGEFQKARTFNSYIMLYTDAVEYGS